MTRKIPSPEQALEREIKEEAGVSLKELKKKGLLQEITPLGPAVTPAFVPQRFATSFFKITLVEKVPFKLDKGEIKRGYWHDSQKTSGLFLPWGNSFGSSYFGHF